MTDIEERIKTLPTGPGVYIMKGKTGEVLYIGKANNLKARVRSYFRGTDTRPAVRFLAQKVQDIEYIVTGTEKEALLLEDTLLKEKKPKYNIRLKDSKTYVSIKITVQEKFPRLLITREIKRDGARYFGPYISTRAVRETLKLLRRIFPICVCETLAKFKSMTRPCLDYQLGFCSAPAVGLISEEAYRDLVNGAIMFLEGRNAELLAALEKKMDEASKNLEFEKAAKIRDQVSAIEEMLEAQRVVSEKFLDQDIFALARGEGKLALQALFVRNGRLTGSSSQVFKDTGLPDPEILSSFVAQFYSAERFIPREVILPVDLEDREVLSGWLTERTGKKVTIIFPKKGDRLKLLRMAEENAREALKKRVEKAPNRETLTELQRRLHLGKTPEAIEAFDISNLGGRLAVGAMVTFSGGAPDKTRYRLFRIRFEEGPDDYAMMHEVMYRRYSKTMEGAEGALPLPDLILVDGGKGQLNIAIKVLQALGIKGVEIAALAKERPEEAVEEEKAFPGKRIVKGERVYLPHLKDAIPLREGSKPDLLLRRVRDEVHRFAITYQRKLRGKEAFASPLDRIPGIGEKKKKALYERFGDIEGISRASVEELMRVPGITEKIAVAIKEELGKTGMVG